MIHPEDRTIARHALVSHLQQHAGIFRGRLLNAGCGDRTYEYVYQTKITSQVRLDWPKTLHDRSKVDVFGDVSRLPFGEHSFDVILCTEVLEHVRDPMATLLEFFRVLRPGGSLVVSVPFLYQIHEQPYDFYRYTYFGLRHLFLQSGFVIEKLLARGDMVSVSLYFFRKTAARLVSKLIGSKMGSKIPYTLLDRIYIRLAGRRLANLDAEKTAYALGYTALVRKPV